MLRTPESRGFGRLQEAPQRIVLERAGPVSLEPTPSAWERRKARWRASRQDGLIVAVLVVVAAVLHGINMTHSPSAYGDEGTYISQAWSVETHFQLAPYTYWYDHPPLGWLLLAVWNTMVFAIPRHVSLLATDRAAMLVAFCVSVLFVYLLARRLALPRWASVLATVVFIVSPITMTWDRFVLLDNIATPFTLAAFFLANNPRHRLGAAVGTGAAFAAAVLSKETALLFLPFLAWNLWRVSTRSNRAFALTLSAGVFVALGSFYPLYAVLKGELIPGRGHVSLFGSVAWQLTERKGTGNVFAPGSQAHSIVATWLQLDPWLLIGALVLLPVAWLHRPLRPIAAGYVLLALLPLRPGYLPLTEVVDYAWPAALLIGAAAAVIWQRARRARFPRAAATAVLAVGAVVFPLAAMHDVPVVVRSLTANNMAPAQAAERWVRAHVSRHDNVLVGNNVWMNLVRHGYSPVRTVWFAKLGVDPGVGSVFPNGWRNFQYIVESPTVKSYGGQYPQVEQAIAHGKPVAAFGVGGGKITVLRITGNGADGGYLAPGRNANGAVTTS